MRNWTFGAYVPTKNAKAVFDQMWLAHKYQNRLIELELDRRKLVDNTLQQLCPDYFYAVKAEQNADLDVVTRVRAIKDSRSNSKSRSPATAEQRTELLHARDILKGCRKRLKLEKTSAFASEAVKQRLSEIDSEHLVAFKAARAACGCYWPTYCTIEVACKDIRKGSPPRFKRWTGNGMIAIQFQNQQTRPCPLASSLINGNDSRLQIQSIDGKHATVKFRVGTDEQHQPIWCEFPVVLHRSLPSVPIKWCYLERHQHGPRTIYQFRMCLDSIEGRRPTGSGVAAVHVGWRLMPDRTIRVATVYDASGVVEELRIDARHVAQIHKLADIQGIRDDNGNVARAKLVAMLKDLDPEWLRGKSPARGKSLRELGRMIWRRQHSDDRADDELERWRKHDRHLDLWICSAMLKTQRWRKQLYRNFVARLAERYEQVIIADVDLLELKRREDVLEETTQEAIHRRHNTLASCGKLHEYLRDTFVAAVVSCVNITRTCPECHAINDYDRTRINVTCSCGRTWDQDHAAARNMFERLGDGEMTGVSRKPDGDVTCGKNGEKKLSKRREKFAAARKSRAELIQ